MESNEDIKQQLSEIKSLLIEVDEINDNNKAELAALVKSQTQLLLSINEAGRQSRIALRKDIRQLQGLIVAIVALVVFFFGYSNKESRTAFLETNGQELIALAMALAGGYRVMKSQGEAADEEQDITRVL